MIRWKKRLSGWAMFRGTSRKPSAWVRVWKEPGKSTVCIARVSDFKTWLKPPSIAEAKRWCERTPPYGWEHVIDESVAIVVLPDGTVERRAVERTRDIVMHWMAPPLNMKRTTFLYDRVPIEEVVLHGRVFAIEAANPMTGDYIQWRVLAYSMPKHNHIADELAKLHLEDLQQKHHYRGLDKPLVCITTPGLCL